MKKIFYLFVVTFISLFIINMDKVQAKQCSYGVKDSKGNWTEKIVIDVRDWDKYDILIEKSPIFGKMDYDPLTEHSIGELKYYSTSYRNGKGVTNNLKIYLALYPSADVYNQLEKKCPAILEYKYDFQFGGIISNGSIANPLSYDNVFAIYNDDLNSDTTTGADIFMDRFLGANIEIVKGEFVEKEHKDEDIEKLRDKYNCLTYTSSIESLKKAKEKFGTCDNNSEFTYQYDKLYSLCEAFRSTSAYATEDSNGEIGAKSCMTACSNLKDDVAEICNRNFSTIQCGSLGQKIVKWIYRIIRMVRYAIPVLIIILSILDYIKAIGSDSDDEMKKATGKFFKRLIVAAIIFIIPFILEFILRIFHLPGLNSNNPFCAN